MQLFVEGDPNAILIGKQSQWDLLRERIAMQLSLEGNRNVSLEARCQRQDVDPTVIGEFAFTTYIYILYCTYVYIYMGG